jgi:hypothetical protein
MEIGNQSINYQRKIKQLKKLIKYSKVILCVMNIFYLSAKPGRCARWHCDKHVVKMILETTQILYTCHHANGGTELVEKYAPKCNNGMRGYKKHAVNHPSVIWARSSLAHYIWLCWLGLALVKEYNHRFNPIKPHSCLVHLRRVGARGVQMSLRRDRTLLAMSSCRQSSFSQDSCWAATCGAY